MEYVVSFFNTILNKVKEVKNNVFGILKRSASLTLGASIFIIIGIYLLRTPSALNSFFALATNVRENARKSFIFFKCIMGYTYR